MGSGPLSPFSRKRPLDINADIWEHMVENQNPLMPKDLVCEVKEIRRLPAPEKSKASVNTVVDEIHRQYLVKVKTMKPSDVRNALEATYPGPLKHQTNRTISETSRVKQAIAPKMSSIERRKNTARSRSTFDANTLEAPSNHGSHSQTLITVRKSISRNRI